MAVKIALKSSLIILVLVLTQACTNKKQDNTQKYLPKKEVILNVSEKIIPIELSNELLLGELLALYESDQYLFIVDYKATDNAIHAINKSDYKYIKSFAPVGKGPAEIVRVGHLYVDQQANTLLVSDHGKNKIFSFDIDSLMQTENYIPSVKFNMSNKQFPNVYTHYKDNSFIASIIKPTGNSGYVKEIAIWDISDGAITPINFDYLPTVEKKRVTFDYSKKDNLIIEVHSNNDLFSIYHPNGSLVANVYGASWTEKADKMLYYKRAIFCNDKILATYYGEDRYNRSPITSFKVFTKTGDYLKTIELGYDIADFCYDSTKGQVILSLNDEMQLAYLDLKDIEL